MSAVSLLEELLQHLFRTFSEDSSKKVAAFTKTTGIPQVILCTV